MTNQKNAMLAATSETLASLAFVDAHKVKKKVTASILRDTFVVRSLRQGVPLDEVLQKIGLSDYTWKDARNKYERLASKAI